LIRSSVRTASISLAALLALSLPSLAKAQTDVPAAPEAPSAPAAAPVFPQPDPANFTAAAPTKQTVEDFLRASWGYEDNRIWQVQAILKTPIEGVSKVVVLIGDKTGKEKPQGLAFYVMADGKHIISGDSVVDFGSKPYAELREKLQKEANGPFRGAVSKDLEIVEFADFQCPHCKAAQPNLDKLVTDYPQARIVFQTDPIAQIHPQAVKAASYGLCVAKQAGNTAFFQYAAAVFDGQEGLENADGAQLTLNSAVAKAGADAAKIAACAASAETKAAVDASVKLAESIGINQVPTLVINGRQVPANAPYDTLKKIVDFQIQLDGLKK
jgi:protein-disulfide isomerase